MNILGSLSSIPRSYSPTSLLGNYGQTPELSGLSSTDLAGLSPEAMMGGAGDSSDVSSLLSGMMQAFGGGQPQDPVAQVQAEIQSVRQQMAFAEGFGDQEGLQTLNQKLQQLMAKLAELTGAQGQNEAPGSDGSGGGGGDSGTSMGGGDVGPSSGNTAAPAPSATPNGSATPSNNTSSPGAALDESGPMPMAGSSDTPIAGAGTQQYDDFIREAAEKYGVDPNLVKSVVQQESSFNPNAGSPKGALGLMQLMPGTAADLGVTNRLDPQQSINGGTKYLAQQLDAFGGDVKLALAAYNAGPGNVRKAGGIPNFAETQEYVAKVTADYAERTALANAAGAVNTQVASNTAAPASSAKASTTPPSSSTAGGSTASTPSLSKSASSSSSSSSSTKVSSSSSSSPSKSSSSSSSSSGSSGSGSSKSSSKA